MDEPFDLDHFLAIPRLSGLRLSSIFSDENQWLLEPGNARLWYATVLAFLDEHVLGRPWQRPELV